MGESGETWAGHVTAEVGVMRSALLQMPGIIHGFSTREGGVSPAPFDSLNLGESVGDLPANVAENQRRWLSILTGDDSAAQKWQLATARQVHGAAVLQVPAPETGRFVGGDADALITDQPGWMVGVKTADCVPILLLGWTRATQGTEAHPVVAAVHAGWRGTTLRIVQETCHQMLEQFGVERSSIRAVVGPAIGPEAYPVGQEVVTALERALEGAPGQTVGVVLEPGAFAGQAVARVDLPEANRRLLLEMGVPAEQITVLNVCVWSDAQRFFSHRRDSGVTGRMLSCIGILPLKSR